MSTAAAQNVTFIFRPVGGGTNITLTASVPATGVFSLPSVPSGNYNLWIKGSKYLAQVVSVNLTSGNVTGVTSVQHAGDADNSNAVDVGDFGSLINAYGSSVSNPGSGYNIAADFNGDGSVDVADFALLVNNYSTVGAL